MTKRGWRSNDGSITSVDPGNLLVPPIFTKLYQVTHVQYQVTHVFYQVTHVLTLKWLTQTNIIVMASLVACWIIHLPPPYIKLHTTQGAYKSMPDSIYICTFKTNLHWLVCQERCLIEHKCLQDQCDDPSPESPENIIAGEADRDNINSTCGFR